MRKDRIVTKAELLSWRPCYSEPEIDNIARGRDSMSLDEIFDLGLPEGDLLWILTRPALMGKGDVMQFFAELLDWFRQYGQAPEGWDWPLREIADIFHRQAEATKKDVPHDYLVDRMMLDKCVIDLKKAKPPDAWDSWRKQQIKDFLRHIRFLWYLLVWESPEEEDAIAHFCYGFGLAIPATVLSDFHEWLRGRIFGADVG